MSIQFSCSSCGQPIEVDVEFAGKQAGCPYCGNVVNVPTETTYQPGPVSAARPPGPDAGEGESTEAARSSPATEPAPPPPPGSLHVGEWLTPRERAARSFGNCALICTALALLLFGAVMVQVFVVGFDKLEDAGATRPAADTQGVADEQDTATSQPLTPERLTQRQTEAVEQAMQELQSKPVFMVISCGAELFAVIGLALAITSLVQSRRRNWRGVVGVVICGLFVLCICGGTAFRLALGGGMPV